MNPPKQIAGKGVTRPSTPKRIVGVGITTPPAIPQKEYGVRYKVLWKGRLMKPRMEIIKIMSETDWNVKMIDSQGVMHQSVTKDKFQIVAFVDKDGNEELVVDVECQGNDIEGQKLKILWKKNFMEPKIEIVSVIEESDYSCDIVDSSGNLQKTVVKSDMIILEVLEFSKIKPEGANVVDK